MPRHKGTGTFYKETEILLNALRGKRVLFLSHAHPDLDTLSSGYALAHFFAPKCKNVIHGCPDQKAGHAVQHAGFMSKYIRSFEDVDVIVCVDFRSPMQAGELQPALSTFPGKIIILDHHVPSSNEFAGDIVRIIRPTSIATAQMVTQIGMEMDSEFTPTISTALAAAIIADSARFAVANEETFRVIDFLLSHSKKSYEKVLTYAIPTPPVFERVSVMKSMKKSEIWSAGDYLLAVARAPFHGGMVAHAMVKLGADIGLGISTNPSGSFCSIRLSPHAHVQLGLDATKVLTSLSKKHALQFGGHPTAAQANLPPYLSEEILINAFARELLVCVRKKDKTAQLKKRN